jgi:hypothetical protein
MIAQALRPDLTERDFAVMALDLLRHQAGANPVYRSFLQASGFRAETSCHWSEFPALPVEAFRSDPVTCFNPSEATVMFETSGTTGKSTGRHYLKDARYYKKALKTAFLHFMPDLSQHRWISLVPSQQLRPHSSLATMIGHLGQSIPQLFPLEYVSDVDFKLDQSNWRRVLEEVVKRNQATALFGTSFALAQAAEDLLEKDGAYVLPPGSLIFDTGGYKGRHRELRPEQLLDLVERALGIPSDCVWNEYGMTELSSQGYGKLEEGLHRFPPWLKIRVIDPATGTDAQTGQRGLLHFYDLANVDSIMAVATQDTGIREGEAIRLTGRLTAAPERGCSLPFEV